MKRLLTGTTIMVALTIAIAFTTLRTKGAGVTSHPPTARVTAAM